MADLIETPQDRIKAIVLEKLRKATDNSSLKDDAVKVETRDGITTIKFFDNNGFNTTAAAVATVKSVCEGKLAKGKGFVEGNKNGTKAKFLYDPEFIAEKLAGAVYEQELRTRLSGASPECGRVGGGR